MRKKNIFIAIICLFFAVTTHCREEIKPKKPYKILCLDGGGIRGVFTLRLLSMLDNELNFLKNIDLFAGTSTGSIIATGLSIGFTPDEMIDFYKEKGDQIFQSYSKFDPLYFWARYSHDSLKEALGSIISENMLLSEIKKKVLSINFELFNETQGTWAPCFLDNFDNTIAENTLVIDSVIRSSSAPTYFPSYQNCIDGGVVANNPSMVALARAIDSEGANQNIENIRLLSVGTGKNIKYIKHDIDWGIFPWTVYHKSEKHHSPQHPLISIILDGGLEIPHYQCSQILKEKYFRLNGFLAQNVPLDDASQIDYLIEAAERIPSDDPHLWHQLKKWIEDNFCQ